MLLRKYKHYPINSIENISFYESGLQYPVCKKEDTIKYGTASLAKGRYLYCSYKSNEIQFQSLDCLTEWTGECAREAGRWSRVWRQSRFTLSIRLPIPA